MHHMGPKSAVPVWQQPAWGVRHPFDQGCERLTYSGGLNGKVAKSGGTEGAARQAPAGKAMVDYLPQWVTPNSLTIMRLALAPLILILDFHQVDLGWLILLGLIAGMSDLADGALARRRGLVSKLGAFLDPLGDKFFAVVLLVMVWRRGFLEPWLVLLILACEIHTVAFPLLSLVRRLINRQKLWPPPKVAPNRFGKVKTAWMASSMGLILIGVWLGLGGVSGFGYVNLFVAIGLGLIAEALYIRDYCRGEFN